MNRAHARRAEVDRARSEHRAGSGTMKRLGMILLALPMSALLFLAPLTAEAARRDWQANGEKWTPAEYWSYWIHPSYPHIHYSKDENNHTRDHVTYKNNNVTYRYYGNTSTFNGNPDENMAATLVRAWNDYNS